MLTNAANLAFRADENSSEKTCEREGAAPLRGGMPVRAHVLKYNPAGSVLLYYTCTYSGNTGKFGRARETAPFALNTMPGNSQPRIWRNGQRRHAVYLRVFFRYLPATH